MPNYVAESDRLLLRAIETEDDVVDIAEEYFAAATNELTTAFSTRTPPTSIDEAKQALRIRLPTPEEPWRRVYALFLRGASPAEQPKYIGAIMIPRVVPGQGYEIGYGLHSDYWGKGYASEMLKMFIGVYWATPRPKGEDQLIAVVEPLNIPSTHLVQRAGFKKGELKPGVFKRARDGPEEPLRDLQFWYLEPPPQI